MFVGGGQPVFQSYHYGNRLHHRPKLPCQKGIIDCLHIVLEGLVVGEVGDCFNLAGSHFHHHTRCPFGTLLETLLVEHTLHDVLDFHIDSGLNVIASHRLHLRPILNLVGELHFHASSGLAVKKRVESTLQPGRAMHPRGVNVADASARHLPVRLFATIIHILAHHAATTLFAEIRQG